MLGEKIRKHRKLNHLTQEELAQKLGVSRQKISLWENNRTQPTLEDIVDMSRCFGIKAVELISESNEDTNIKPLEAVFISAPTVIPQEQKAAEVQHVESVPTQVESEKNVTENSKYRIKDPRSDLEWTNPIAQNESQLTVKDSREDGVRMYYDNTYRGRVPKARCLKFKGKYYCPGAVFKLNEKWAKEHGILTVLPVHCWTDYNNYIDQESLYLEYKYYPYGGIKTSAHFYRRLFPFANMSKWEELPPETTLYSNHYVVGEFIDYYDVKEPYRKNVDVAIPLAELENALDLVDGYEWNLERFPEVSDVNIPENKIAIIIYIVAMLGALIFKEPYGLWLVFTIAFFGFTQTMRDRYGGEKS